MDDLDGRVEFFRGMLNAVSAIPLTVYDGNYTLLSSNSPFLELFQLFFTLDDATAADRDFSAPQEVQPPKTAVFTNSLGMSWISSALLEDGRISRVYLIGPAFLDDYSMQKIELRLDAAQVPMKLKHHFLGVVKALPVVPLNRFYEYGVMLHYALTGQTITTADLLHPLPDMEVPEDELVLKKSNGAYLVEEALLKMVEEGNLNYQQVKQQAVHSSDIGRLAAGDHVRQAKNTVIIFCTLCAKAAIRGGLPPQTAYYLREQYIYRLEGMNSLAQIHELNQNMLSDFVKRVHRNKISSGISPQIKQTCDYICLHPEEKLDIHQLASRLGYTDYYFSSKFRKEVGISVRDFITKQKIEKAKQLLCSTNTDIQDIADLLGYGSQSHFGEVFRAETGMTPRAYRNQAK